MTETTPALEQVGSGLLGTGVDVASYQRIRDSYLDIQLRSQTMRQGTSQAQSDGLSQVENTLSEPSDSGLSSLLSSYWSSWQDVANDPSDMATRQSLVQSAASLANGFNSLSSQLSTIATQTGQQETSTMGQVNSYGAQIAALNQSIQAAELGGNQPNDLLDKRDLLVDQLSALGNTTVAASAGQAGTLGAVDVTFGGSSLVAANTANTLALPLSITSGQLAGMQSVVTSITDPTTGYLASLNTLAATLASATNSQNALGKDITGATGGPIFDVTSGSEAATISVDPAIANNPGLIAASGNGDAGDGSNALAPRQPAVGGARERRDDRHRLPAARHEDRLRFPAGAVEPRQRELARPVDLEPAAVGLGRLARRGDDEPPLLPAGLPGLRAGHVGDGLDDQHPDHERGRIMSERITSGMMTSTLLSDLNNVQNQLTETQQQLSSGMRIQKPSDDPFGTGQALLYQADLASNTQYQSNVNDGTSWLNATGTALSDMTSDVQRVRTLLVEAANTTEGTQGNQDIALEVSQLIDSIKTDGNTQYAGQYVFSGTKTSTAPYAVGGADTYSGDTGAVSRQIGPGVQVQINLPGSSVIGDGATSGSLLNVLNTIVSDLNSNNTSALGTTDLSALDTASDNLSSAQATVGAVSNRLSTALSRLQSLQQSTTQLLSNDEDADMAQETINYSQQEAVYEAALKAGANIIQPSLMDFLSTS